MKFPTLAGLTGRARPAAAIAEDPDVIQEEESEGAELSVEQDATTEVGPELETPEEAEPEVETTPEAEPDAASGDTEAEAVQEAEPEEPGTEAETAQKQEHSEPAQPHSEDPDAPFDFEAEFARTEALPTVILSTPTELLRRILPTRKPKQASARVLDGGSVRRELFGETTAAELVADDISAWFGTHKVLDRVSLTMEAGKVTALIGPSGCGKSTFLRILNRMHEMIPTASLYGEVRLDGQDIYAPSQRITAARRNIGMVFQKPNPFPAMSIYDNAVAGLKLAGVQASRDYRDFLVEDSLRKASLWDEVKDRLEQPGGGLSGGQQQRLCIARSLAVSPGVLLMDEPCSALDPTSTRRVEETIESLRGQVTVVIVTHNMQQAARVSDTCAFFLAAQNTPGVIVEYGDTEAMFDSPQDQRTSDYVHGRFG